MRAIVTLTNFAFITGLFIGSVLLPRSAIAQVVPDGTLPTIVTSIGNSFTIEGGARSGNNLFHSFSQFSVPTGGAAIFNNAIDIQNIFSRVTGGVGSTIDGVIQANGTANLFLLNPSGILFGPNASLNIGGSFIGTTADSIKFADGVEFSAANANGSPLLTMSVPVGLQMGQNPGEIQVQGPGHDITRIGLSLLNRGTPKGLQVSAGNTLALVGGNIILDGGLLVADSGKIELAALSNGPWMMGQGNQFANLGSMPTPQFGDIQLRAAALVDVSGLPAGSIEFMGGNITLQDGSIVLGQNLGTQPGGNIQILGSKSLLITGTTPFVSSRITTQPLGSGQGGSINISVPRLILSDGGSVASQTFSSAQSGDLTVQAPDSIQITGTSPLDPSNLSALTTATFSPGNSGTLTVSTGTLTLRDGAQITSPTVGSGNAGRVTVNATNLIDIQGTSLLSNSAIVSNSFGQGDAGTTIVNAPRLRLRDGGAVFSAGLSSGNAGNIIINAQDSIEITNSRLLEDDFDKAKISSSTQFASPILQVILGLPPIPTGKSGSVIINTPQLTMTNGAIVSVENPGSNKGGTVEINANVMNLNNSAKISAVTASGTGGDIILNIQDILLLRYNSELSTQSGGTGNGGNIIINAPIILGLENSDIIANAFKGRGGNIEITTQGILGLKYRDQLTSENDITASSEFGVNGTVDIITPGIDLNSGLISLPVELVDPSQQIAQSCATQQGSSFVISGRGGMHENPINQFTPYHPWADLRRLTPDRHPVTAPAAALLPTLPLVEAVGWRRTREGQMELFAAAQPTTELTALPVTCAGGK